MSVKRRPDGKYRARYRDDAGREHSRHFARKADAERWLDEVTASRVTGTYSDPKAGRVTFGRFYAEWSPRQVWAPGTEKAMTLAAESVTFWDVPMRSIRRSHVEEWVKRMQTKPRGEKRPIGLAPGTIRTRFNNVAAIFRAAVLDRVISVDPSKGVTLPRVRRAEAAMTIPTTAQVGALLRAAEGSFSAFLALAAFAGLRLGEAAATQVGDIDFLGRLLHVRRQVQRRDGGGVDIRPPKYGSERTISIPDHLVTVLARHLEERRLGAVAGSAWLFEGEPGQPPHQNTVGYRWRRTCSGAGVSGFKLHDLRHFYASGLIASGCDVVTVQRALGHRSPSVTLNTYAHLWPTAEDRTRAAAQALMAAALDVEDPRAADFLRTKPGH
jgi:integrase